MSLPPQDLDDRARKIELLVLDVDGVLTDGRLLYLSDGTELKSFSARDGLGLQLWAASGARTAIISGRESAAVERRARELGIEMVHQGITDKVGIFEELLDQLGLGDAQAAYVGDDLPDLPCVVRAGLGFAPADAARELRQAADVVLRTNGGQGAVRETCERLLRAKGAWKV